MCPVDIEPPDITDYDMFRSPGPEILKKLRESPGSGWYVGGAVRDVILGRTPEDWDFLLTGIDKASLKKGFPGGEVVGSNFPIFLWRGVEITWTGESSPEKNLMSRDFTINSLTASLADKKIRDPQGGLQDLKERILQPLPRSISADPLRVYRAFRFKAEISGLTFSPLLKKKLKLLSSGEIECLFPERVTEEFKKIFTSPRPAAFIIGLKKFDLLSHHFSWLESPEKSLDRLRIAKKAGCKYSENTDKILFVALAFESAKKNKMDRARSLLTLPEKWIKAAEQAVEVIPVIRNWQKVPPIKLVEAQEIFDKEILDLQEALVLAAGEDVRVGTASLFQKARSRYDDVFEIMKKLKNEISGDDLPEKVKGTPEAGEELRKRKKDWLETERDKHL